MFFNGWTLKNKYPIFHSCMQNDRLIEQENWKLSIKLQKCIAFAVHFMLIVSYANVFITLDAVTFAVYDNDHKGNCSNG